MTIRKILYGYQIQRGELAVVPQEAETVRRITTLYLAGASYQKISASLNGDGIPFSSEVLLWNKHKVKHLLENPRFYREEEGKSDAIITPDENEEIRYYRRRVHLPLIISENLCDPLTEGPCKLLAISLHNPGKLESFRRNIADWAEDKIQTIYSNKQYLELFDKSAGKGSSLRFLCDYLQVPLSDVYAAGDADNDISMLEAAGCGIAMKNASDKVKAHADVVTDLDNDRNGLADTMYKLISLRR